MANLTTTINVNVPTDVKEEATSIFDSIGLKRGIPFEVKQRHSKELSEALKELDYMECHSEEYKVYHDVDKMFEDILDEE